ncbi:hypothetical protein HN592_00915 [Candidatus Woesearchaeota archaeon]|jgi:hypothetical protein|nr:hypothetical protein [Candidatus Woesearchaeota archaeon]MBT4368865.1 hypothetical protein [Candidatus Woesearchaeota archaeon]MBT4712154.1 hypothetical protein [Candidatus Woesearchaeota archaeon]MBT6639098.1 hypothetical protein [Candidatus Woesearchaeota archaeon]MBT7134298.1 hypothetical protein [Candidatus Woesearchaeota archaeon]
MVGRIGSFYNGHRKVCNLTGGVLLSLGILGTGAFGVRKYAEGKADAARTEERQAAAEREAQLRAQMAAQQRAAGRRTNFRAFIGSNRYDEGMRGRDKLKAGASGRFKHTDEQGNQTPYQNGWIARGIGLVDGGVRGAFAGLKNYTSRVPVLNYGTKIVNGTANGIMNFSVGAVADVLEATDKGLAKLFGYDAMKPIDPADPRAKKPAVNTGDPESAAAIAAQGFGGGLRLGWLAWMVDCHRDHKDDHNNNNNNNGNNGNNNSTSEPDLDGILEGGNEFTN